MSHSQIVYFGVTLFFALVALSKWVRRRQQAKARVKRGLHSYVSASRETDAVEDMVATQ
jgi:hypothetical protein